MSQYTTNGGQSTKVLDSLTPPTTKLFCKGKKVVKVRRYAQAQGQGSWEKQCNTLQQRKQEQ